MERKKYYTSLILLFLFATLAFSASGIHFSVIQSTSQTIRLKVSLDKPEILTENQHVYAAYTNATYAINEQNCYVPVITKLINLGVVGTPDVQILNLRKNSLSLDNYLTTPRRPGTSSINSDDLVHIRYIGKYQSLPLYALDFYPVRYHSQSRQLEWVTEAEISVRLSGGKRVNITIPASQTSSGTYLKSFLLNDKSIFTEPAPQKNSTIHSSDKLFKSYATIYKLEVDRDGIYKITYDDLSDAGFPLDLVTPANLKLYNNGSEIPIYFRGAEDGTFDEDDYFEFWGVKNKKTFLNEHPDMYADPFTDINVYWLVDAHTPGIRLTEESGGLIGNTNGYIFEPYAYTETLHFEQDKHNEKLGQSGIGQPSYLFDHWFYDSGISAPEGIAYDFYLPYPFESGSDVVITAAMRGKSYRSSANQLAGHQVELKLRGKGDVAKLIGQVRPEDGWVDQDMRFISNADSAVKLSQSVLVNGINRLEVDMFQTGVTDIVLLNWFDVSYKRKYRAYKNYIKFHVDRDFFNNSYVHLGDNIQINVDGFDSEDISIYKLGVSKIVNGKIGYVLNNNFHSFGISIQDQIFDPSTEYVAVTEEAKLKPLSIYAFRRWDENKPTWTLMNTENSADYLIITNRLFYDSALKLRDLKERQGLHPLVVLVENIYDIFNMGIKSPLAIKNFIAYALHYWKTDHPLKYVVLVGTASYDYKGIYSKGADLVPTFMYQTMKYGAASSDYWYALIDGDDYIPDVSVARIPASSNQELLNYIDKLEHFGDAEEKSDWRNTSLFISGNDSSSVDKEAISLQPIFRSQNLRLINQQLPESIFSNRLNTVKDKNISGYDPSFGSTTDLIEYFDSGLSFINYFGHGGGGIWADVSLLNLSDVDRLNNGYKLPFISSMTCYTADFSNPGRLGLAEKLILSEQKGAIAVLGASGVGWKYNDLAIDWGLFDFLWNKNLSFGEAVDLMKIYYLANPVYVTETKEIYTYGYGSLKHSMVAQYNLLGDPSLKLAQPERKLQVQVSSSSVAPGDTVHFVIQGGIASGSGRMRVEDNRGRVARETYFSYVPGKVLDFVIPDNSAGILYTAKVYVTDSDMDANGSVKVAVRQPIVHRIVTTPAHPSVNESIDFFVSVSSLVPVKKMELINFRAYNQVYGFSERVEMNRVNDTLFQSVQPFSGFTSGGEKLFDVSVVTDDTVTTVIRRQHLTVKDTRADVAFVSGSLSYSGTAQLQLSFAVENNSDSSLSALSISCYDTTDYMNSQPFTQLSIPLEAHQEKTITVAYSADDMKSERSFTLLADPGNVIAESNENNNILQAALQTDRIFIDRKVGTSEDGFTNSPIKLGNSWDYHIAANSLPASAVIRFSSDDLADFIKSKEQGGLKFVPFASGYDTSAIEIDYPEILENSTFNAQLAVHIDTSKISVSDRPNIAIFKFDPFLNLWIRTNSQLQNDTVSTQVTQSGKYAVFNANDHVAPTIEVTANGRPLIKDMLVIKKPAISLLLQDENGVNYTRSLSVFIDDIPLVEDGKAISQQEVSIPDSLKNAKAISVTTSPSLLPGKHKLKVTVADANGNMSTEEYTFVVTDGFGDIRVFGNYPNPFSDQTIISFYVDSDNEIDDLSIKIYTTSGRLVRRTMLTLDESVATDNIRTPYYHELIWDGTDDDGVPVANGVYFLVLSGSYKGKTITHTLKIARLQ